MPRRPDPPVPIRRAVSIPVLIGAVLAAACSGGGATAPAGAPDPPRITALDPLEGAVGTRVEILGEGFGTDPEAVRVTFEGEPADLEGIEGTALRVLVPELEPGKASVVVTVEGRASNTGTFRVVERGAFRPPTDGTTGRWTRSLVLGEVSGAVSFDGTSRVTGSIVFDDGRRCG